jgi:hypothetical protein
LVHHKNIMAVHTGEHATYAVLNKIISAKFVEGIAEQNGPFDK